MKLKRKNRKIIIIIAIIVAIIVGLSTLIAKNVNNSTENLDTELLRSMNYTQINDSDSDIENTDFVKFSAFFTRDLDGDGNAEKLLGTCREVGYKDVLYMDLNVLSNGYLTDGKITINGTNFNYSMNMVKDSVLQNNYISNNVKVIQLNQVNAGTQKLIMGNLITNIGTDTNNYSSISSITLTGTYVSDEGVKTPIEKTIDLTVDWHGKATAQISSATTTYYYDKFEDDYIEFRYTVRDSENKLLLKENVSEVTIPDLNGYAPTEVVCTNSNIESEYNNETQTLKITRSSVCDENGIITSTLSSSNTYTIKVKYPQEAFDAIDSYTKLTMYVTGYYTGYNNPNKVSDDPEGDFKNPYKSNIATGQATIVFTEDTPTGYIYNFYVDIIGKKHVSRPSSRYVISKQDILNLYDSEEEPQNKEFVIKWTAVRGNLGVVPSMIMSETRNSDNYGDKWDEVVMDNYITNTGIYFSGTDTFLQDDGSISIYNDETNELIATFTKEELARYTESNPYKYEESVKHIRIETTTANPSTSLYAYNIKELDVNKVLENYTKEELKAAQLVYTYLTGICNIEDQKPGTLNKLDYAYFASEKSDSKITVETKKLSTSETLKNQKIYIDTLCSQEGDAKWQNGEFLVEIPEEIINMEINNITVNDKNVKIAVYDLFKKDGKYFVKIITENENPSSYKITINCNMTPDPSCSTTDKVIKLYSYNEYCNDYYYETQDIYDVDSDNNVEEKVGTSSDTINFLSPTSLITLETISNYNEANEVTIAPNVAEVEKDVKQATVNVYLTNNYPNTVTGVQILGKIPFEGNTYIINGGNLESKFSTTMTNEGINLPEELKEKAIVYYSEKENPDKDLLNAENGWTLKENVQDFSKIKTYLIDLGENTIQIGEEHAFNYVINIPENVNYNSVAYSNHAVYYELDTEGGNLSLSTEPNKVGVRVIKKFDLDLTKYKKGFEKIKVAGAAYTLQYVDVEGISRARILTTNSNGYIGMQDLYVGITYTIKELRSPQNYMLNDETIEFKVVGDDDGNLQLETTSESVTLDNEIVHIKAEDEPKYKITLTKTDEDTEETLSNVVFKINGEKYVTDKNGQITIERLEPDKEYTLTESKRSGYYVLDDIKFKLTKNSDGNMQIESDNEALRNATIENTGDEDFIQVNNIILTNKKIPTYDLQILKVSEDSKEDDIEKLQPLSGAKFRIESKDLGTKSTLDTDENGIANIYDLYEYVEGKYITGTYIIQEIQSPDGYSNNAEEIELKVTRNKEDKLEIRIENQEGLTSVKDVQIEDNIVKVIIQDKPLFKLTKVDEETKEPLANVQFVIHEINESGNKLNDAKDVNGDFVGELNEYGEHVVTTDETGTITLPLRDGTYKIIEITYPEGYQQNGAAKVFKISNGKSTQEQPESTPVVEIDSIEDLVELSNAVNSGNSYSGTKIKLMKTLDFEDDNSYDDPTSTRYGDINSDKSTEGIKAELTNRNGLGFKPIGIGSLGSNPYCFSGVFDGQGYEIRNLYINRSYPVSDQAGLFGFVQSGTIMNLGVTGEINGSRFTGGIAAKAANSSISNCYNVATVNCISVSYGSWSSNTKVEVGGIVGYLYGGSSINNCYNLGELEAKGGAYSAGELQDNNVGGIVGIIDSSSINNCYNTAFLSLSPGYNAFNHIGGIVGSINSGGISSCYNVGKVSFNESIYGDARYYIGGIVGNVSSGSIRNCYNAGEISWTRGSAGGIVGNASSCTTGNCYNIGAMNAKKNTYYGIGAAFAGAIVGNIDGGNVTNCFYPEAISITAGTIKYIRNPSFN